MRFALMTALLAGTAAIAADGPVPMYVSWTGQVAVGDRKVLADAPVVADTKTWEEVWKAARPGEKAPTVDFANAVVLVAVGSDPNLLWFGPNIQEGNLRVVAASTLRAYDNPQTASYMMGVVARAGVKTVNDKPLPVAGK